MTDKEMAEGLRAKASGLREKALTLMRAASWLDPMGPGVDSDGSLKFEAHTEHPDDEIGNPPSKSVERRVALQKPAPRKTGWPAKGTPEHLARRNAIRIGKGLKPVKA